METREMRYFAAVAEELNFGRAAQRLGIAQPPLSRAVAQLERRLDTKLLERTNRGVSLTPAGAVLLRETRTALTAVEAAERRTRRAGTDPDGVRLVSKTGMNSELLAELLHAHSLERPGTTVDVVLVGMGESEAMLRDGRADVALLSLPLDETSGLDHEPLGTENQVAFLPAGHPFGARPYLTLQEATSIPDLPPARWPRSDGSYLEGPGPKVRDPLQMLQLIALGRASSVSCESCAATALREELQVVPVPDAPPITQVIAWPAHSRSAAVAGLVRIATAL